MVRLPAHFRYPGPDLKILVSAIIGALPYAVTGSVKVNVEPLFISFSTQIRPAGISNELLGQCQAETSALMLAPNIRGQVSRLHGPAASARKVA